MIRSDPPRSTRETVAGQRRHDRRPQRVEWRTYPSGATELGGQRGSDRDGAVRGDGALGSGPLDVVPVLVRDLDQRSQRTEHRDHLGRGSLFGIEVRLGADEHGPEEDIHHDPRRAGDSQLGIVEATSCLFGSGEEMPVRCCVIDVGAVLAPRHREAGIDEENTHLPGQRDSLGWAVPLGTTEINRFQIELETHPVNIRTG